MSKPLDPARCCDNEDNWTTTDVDVDLCTRCGEHAEFQECSVCGDSMGSSCCGAGCYMPD